MEKPAKWFVVVGVIALLWNLAGLAAVLADVSLSPADIAALPEAQQALYAARPAWSVWASVIAVVGGSLGCVGLLMRRRWSIAMLAVSLAAVVAQDISLFLIAGKAIPIGTTPVVLQGLVFLIAVGLVLLARKANTLRWLQ